MLDDVAALQGLPYVAGPQGRGACHKDFSIVKGLCPLPGQRYGVRLFLACAGVFVHLIKEKEADSLTCKVRRGIGAGQAQIHTVKLQFGLCTFVFVVSLQNGGRCHNHRKDAVFINAVCQNIRRIDGKGGGRVLLDDVAEDVHNDLGATYLGWLAKNDFFCFVV